MDERRGGLTMPGGCERRVAIIGNGVAGNLAAAYLHRRLPECEIVILGSPREARPIVGESTVEVTAYFLHALGLGQHLEEEHFHKYGLTHYFKEAPGDRACNRYVVHEAPSILRLPAYQLNRFVFDDHLRRRNREAGIICRSQDVAAFEPGASGELHRLELRPASGSDAAMVGARWVVDASGRSRVLARRLGLIRPPANQRSSFWLRLAGFDRSVMDGIDAIKRRHHFFDSYYATHHFYGEGYWIWLIPLRSRHHEDLISVGITYRHDICPDGIGSVADFLAVLSRDHPMIARLLRSGSVEDVNQYRNYFYEAERYYSPEGWFLLGDAAFPSDPINSAGLSTISHQIPQIAAIIEKSRRGQLTARYVDALNDHVAAQLALQDNWSGWYRFMARPAKMAWTVAMANALYFHVVLPAYMGGAFLDGRYARAIAKRLPRRGPDGLRHLNPLTPLLDRLQRLDGDTALKHQIPNMYDRIINWGLTVGHDRKRRLHAARYFLLLCRLRLRLIGILGPCRASLRALLACPTDIARAVGVIFFPTALFRSVSTDDMASPWGTDGAFLQLPPRSPKRGAGAGHVHPTTHAETGGDQNADIHRALEHEREMGGAEARPAE